MRRNESRTQPISRRKVNTSAALRPLAVVALLVGAVMYYKTCVAPTCEICDARQMVKLTRADLDALHPGAMVNYPSDSEEKTSGKVDWAPGTAVNGVFWFVLLSDGTPTAKPVRFEFMVNNGKYSSPSQVVRAVGLPISPLSAIGNMFSGVEVDKIGQSTARFGSIGPFKFVTVVYDAGKGLQSEYTVHLDTQ
jgi:hypothetical protein